MATHLTAADRGSIETLLRDQYTNKAIAARIGADPATIGREIAKGTDGHGIYRSWLGQFGSISPGWECDALSRSYRLGRVRPCST